MWSLMLLELNSCKWSVTEVFVFFSFFTFWNLSFVVWCATLMENNIVMRSRLNRDPRGLPISSLGVMLDICRCGEQPCCTAENNIFQICILHGRIKNIKKKKFCRTIRRYKMMVKWIFASACLKEMKWLQVSIISSVYLCSGLLPPPPPLSARALSQELSSVATVLMKKKMLVQLTQKGTLQGVPRRAMSPDWPVFPKTCWAGAI